MLPRPLLSLFFLALFVLLLPTTNCAKVATSTLLLSATDMPPENVNAVEGKGFLNYNKWLYIYHCNQPSESNPKKHVTVPKIVERPVYFKDEFYLIIISAIYIVQKNDIMYERYTNNLLPPIDFQATSSHIVYHVELNSTTSQMRTTDTVEKFDVTNGAPSRITKISVVNDRAFVSSPGAAFVFDPQTNLVVLLNRYCDGPSCESPSHFITNGTSYLYRTLNGVFKSNGYNSSSVWCDLSSCTSSVALATFKQTNLMFSKTGNTLVLSTISMSTPNSITELKQLPNSNVEIDARLSWVSSDKFYFFVYDSQTPNCTDIWSTSGTSVDTSFEASACVTGATSFKVMNVQEPAEMGYIYFQSIIEAGGDKTVELWEFNKESKAAKSVTVICSRNGVAGCVFDREYYQTVNPTCISHWSTEGFKLRSTEELPLGNSVSSLSVSLVLLVLTSLVSFI